MRKVKKKTNEPKVKFQIDEDLFIIPYGRNYHKIYKSMVSRLYQVYRSGYKGKEKFGYANKRHIKAYIRWLIKRCNNAFYLIAVRKRGKLRIIGFIAIEMGWFDKTLMEEGAIIHEFVVMKEYQHQGIGSKVLRYLLTREIPHYNVKRILLTVGETNDTAYNFYKKLGFKNVQRDVESDKKNNVVWVYMIKEM